jgi:hypothetical protein
VKEYIVQYQGISENYASMNPAYKCEKHLPFICEQCFDEEVQEIQPGQW